MTSNDHKEPPPGQARRTIRSLTSRLRATEGELTLLESADAKELEAERESDRTRRKFLAGRAVLTRALQRLPLVGWLRRALAAGLSRAFDRTRFCLDGQSPLIPPADWPGWPNPRESRREAARVDLAGMTARKRRRRITYLKRLRTAILRQLQDAMKAYAPAREDANTQRQILVGYVFLKWSFRNPRVRLWLRMLLDAQLTAANDRRMFGLTENEALVPETDRLALLRITPRKAAKPRVSTEGASAAKGGGRDPQATSRGASGESAAVSLPARASVPVAAGEDATSRPAPGPIPGWRPCRIPVQGSSDTGVRTKERAWGARLTGRAAVAALPADLLGRHITVTDSGSRTWTTTITDIVSRNARAIVVRNSGRPGRDADPAGCSEEPRSSSS